MALDHDALTDLLGSWLPRQRWFGGKGRRIDGVRLVSDVPLADGDPALHHVLVGVDYADGGTPTEHYQLLLGRRSQQVDRLEHAIIGTTADGVLYDAVHDTELTVMLLGNVAAEATVGPLHFRRAGEELDPTLTSRVLGNEQSNTSLVFRDDYILKLFRKIAPGLNPDLEITRALAEHGSPNIAPPLGWIEGTFDGDEFTFGLMQRFLQFGAEGWALATISVRDLYAEGDLHADEVGGDFAGEAERLGLATAEVHVALAEVLGTGDMGSTELRALAGDMRSRLTDACGVVPELAPYADRLQATYDAVAALDEPARIQRIHGDFHLGQVLRTETGWVLLDFEGEPARPLAERRALESPLRDVAGMLRSFDYAAQHLLMEQGGEPQLEYRAAEWAERNRTAFLDGYARGSGSDPRDRDVLLRAFELDKAVYEVVYEARNRPTWLSIPLGSIERLAGSAS